MNASIYKLRLQDILTLCVMGLLLFGIIMVQSAAMNVSGNFEWHWTERGSRHVVFAALALLVFFVVGNIDYHWILGRSPTPDSPASGETSIFRSPAIWLLGVALFACFVVLIPGIGTEVNGARRWLPLGITQVQPSELGKWGTVLFLAYWLAKRPVNVENFFGFILTLLPIGAICLLVVIEDFGTAALIGLSALCLCLVGRVRLWHLALVIPPIMSAGLWFIMHKEYRWRRMVSFLDPFASPEGEGYHMIQSLLSFSTGGLFGKGLGRGIQKLGYLPEDTTDFIFAVICEELGLFGALLVIALYLGIIYVAWQALKQKKDGFGQLLAFGVGSTIAFQALINIAVATVSVPPKGMSLPLISAGGSGLVITCAALGLLHSVCKFRHGEPAEEELDELEQETAGASGKLATA